MSWNPEYHVSHEMLAAIRAIDREKTEQAVAATSGRGNAGKRRSRASTMCFSSRGSPKLEKNVSSGTKKLFALLAAAPR
ncbi:hypothetical protein ACFIOY_36395 [Bradyrhizobium sp. TZ2]